MLNGIELFVPRVLGMAKRVGIDVSGYEMDHLCYRVATRARYDEIVHAWSWYAAKTYTSLVYDRLITVFVLHHALRICEREIRVIEVPAPKERDPYAEGWEHAEFVIGEPFDDFMARYPDMKDRFVTKSLDKTLNPELGFKLPDGLQIKFHHQPLERVIEIERERGFAVLTAAD